MVVTDTISLQRVQLYMYAAPIIGFDPCSRRHFIVTITLRHDTTINYNLKISFMQIINKNL